MDSFVFYAFLFVHLVSLVTGFGAVIVIDTFGLLWVLKKRDLTAVNQVADVTQKLIWIGWFGLVFSGIGLITIKGYMDNLTWIKLFFVLMLGINGIYLHLLKKSLVGAQASNIVSPIYKFRIGFASFISQLGWWGALTIGFVHRHWRHEINWPQTPAIWMSGIITFLIIIYVIGQWRYGTKSI
ncbi:MAG: hypothetical protein A3H72_02760 [Candidatus Doudnabacteria bacterium RIFCSPLOWO2_02_FULL_48_8]|uniref:DUF2269 domain-containing protein n=1 Tax=Candidatus Doudnabacteria bacterium RIFCSPHIGHO2_01_FULL_46_24 TaxID=1817825 RepID=A0A1F5NV16_9BACT|nr:MAG: hypothetical protein A2720_03120 [Candidatus Doudnabacteria bacterium RIFCSPHIGHO2_01_FULL_46_24]OGE95095.1 MAG: hypothetical protein A3H72_02760 [Candidatus Doudnabacteria bacterium RIFCSPLOWO2_02_FULL_48_8]OGE95773.1 MAG: hypothetical protein A3E98_02895 [Candidatus Doudnabacteria bacterium RIFCSPHIGHO2_12_FULL_48_11]